MSYDCPHGDDPNMCPPCQSPPRGNKRATKVTSDATRMLARFKTQCPACHGLIRIDDPIAKVDDVWVHEESCA